MHNAVTNQIYPKKSQCISLDRIFDMMYETSQVSLSPGLVCSRLYLKEVNRYAKQLTSLAFSITAYYCRLEY